MNIITGYRATPHVTEQQLRDIYRATFGSGVYILNIGSKLAATIVSATEISIADGLFMVEGCAAEVAYGTTESLAITSGSQGMLRKDLVVARYTKASGTGVESMELAVLTGTPAASNPSRPAHTSGSIAGGDTTVEFPLYEVNIDGITISSVTCLATQVELSKKSAVDALTSTVNTLVTRIGSVAMGTSATTVTGAIKELGTKIATNVSNIAAAVTRIAALETKTRAIVGTKHYNVDANSQIYVPLSALSMYMVVVNAASTSNTTRGVYLIGTTTGNIMGIKAVSAAGDAELVDCSTIGGTTGVLRIKNSSSVTMRVTIITTYGTAIS